MSLNKIKYDELEELRRKNEVLMNLLNKLIAFDKKRIFLYPVNVQFVPDYLNIIKEPMDFTTMKQKIQNYKYRDFQEFEKDAFLIINNCYTYNDKSTIYHRMAENLETYYKKITPKIYRKYLNIHLLYHSEDKDVLNNTLYDPNVNEGKKTPVKEIKKNLRPKKQGKVGRPSKVSLSFKNEHADMNQLANVNKKKKKSNNKNLLKTKMQMQDKNNFYDNSYGSFNGIAQNDMYGYNNKAYASLENMLEKENFSTILDTIQNSNDKSKDIFGMLIKVLSDNKNRYSPLCNYVNMSKTLRKVFFGVPISSKKKKNKYPSVDSSENYTQLSPNSRKRNISDKVGVSDENESGNVMTKKSKHSNEEEQDNYMGPTSHSTAQNETDAKTDTSVDRQVSCGDCESPTSQPDSNENNNAGKLKNDNVKTGECQNKFPADTVNNHSAEEVKPPDKENEPEKDFVTYNIEKKELTMKLLNYKESVKKFIGESNLPTFINIFPNIYNILDNADSKNLYYAAFNDLRVFGLDVADFGEFNKKIAYNKNYLMGVGRYHIKNVLTLDKNLSNIMLNGGNKSHFCEQIKSYLSNEKNKMQKTSVSQQYIEGEKTKHSATNTKECVRTSENQAEDTSYFDIGSRGENSVMQNVQHDSSSQLHSNNNGHSDPTENKTLTGSSTSDKGGNTSTPLDNSHLMYSDTHFKDNSNYSNDQFSSESSDIDNLDMRNFLDTYNSYNKKFVRRQQIYRILKNRIKKLFRKNATQKTMS
ncbi:bromodomain containing protein, putative [Plasmodium knowlesi strain H]|uniref:Bromodomain containing protein, putative n=3 Tax=Plasmodium knowlesi TaxID=5850 RepID=A0A5K1UFY0_PLAKH|nr:bromodomain protein, putative [Plasmodium knowlesi strain H]OTN65718.1 putative Bromodomain containing protein [Plasmodium knowlesi]CAA9989784.1 bromodomain protein, putative [Plasmodium knowlesi strain H]SBO22923.1 bromodomain containing protein, putative [Plasmodium knowlesi strain H]SBO22975.1 bromodomain containing protein, putative [Plasmodium knowlesi strain H]VVS79258.1 bromodomain protein, putative [Plasmodium knowlesi strain H]|eukprot:XP_002260507.1 bromodomain containing protein, putative [Plasmodium knowlesi strain H]